ncbi:MAG: UvrD-helicase domain-containing protein [Leptospira sp.]|nr:UvrD-helicase domain-containing protein [Leptospira sp.]
MNFNEEQRIVIESKSKYKQVVAAAGSGKTSTMVGMLAKIVTEKEENPEKILVITFSRKAAAEIRERLNRTIGNSPVIIKTFHAYCLYIIKKYHPHYGENSADIIDPEEKNEFFRNYFKRERFKIGGIPFDLLLSGTENFLKKFFPEVLKEIEADYKKYKEINRKLDFDDLVSIYLEGLNKKEAWAEKARKEVSTVVVDEFQDTDLTQLEWLQKLDPEKLTIVGDDYQSIYGFRGASTIPFLRFKEFFSPCETFFLKTNYRSLPAIIRTSAIPISKNKKNIKKKIIPFREGKAKVRLIEMENENSLAPLSELMTRANYLRNNAMFLCRSNFRIQKIIQAGIPSDRIMTIHAAKGLEFDTVILDLSTGWNLKADEKPETMEEERRILYVGLSRAKNNLFILGVKDKNKNRIEDLFYSYFRFRTKKISVEKLKSLF